MAQTPLELRKQCSVESKVRIAADARTREADARAERDAWHKRAEGAEAALAAWG